MSTSVPELRQLHYFADYEGYCDGRPVLWGQLAHSLEVPADGVLDAAGLVCALRRRAAEAHGLEAGRSAYVRSRGCSGVFQPHTTTPPGGGAVVLP